MHAPRARRPRSNGGQDHRRRLERQRRFLQTPEQRPGARPRASRVGADRENGREKVCGSRPCQGLELVCDLPFVANHGDIRRALGIFAIEQASVIFDAKPWEAQHGPAPASAGSWPMCPSVVVAPGIPSAACAGPVGHALHAKQTGGLGVTAQTTPNSSNAITCWCTLRLLTSRSASVMVRAAKSMSTRP
jgi:hypothetical protein